jgi:hypothetical protein
MDAIATYDSRWLEGRFYIELTAESVRVQGSYALGNRRVETAIPLASLQPRVERLWVRSRLFSFGLWCVVIGFVGSWLLTKQFRMSPYDPLPGMVFVFGVVGLFVMGFTFRRTEFARFVSTGGVPELDVARSGAKADFEEFVAKLVSAISTAHRRAAAV